MPMITLSLSELVILFGRFPPGLVNTRAITLNFLTCLLNGRFSVCVVY